MKKIKAVLLLLTCVSTASIAQNLIYKVPANAVAIVKYAGAALTDKVPVSKIESYAFLKKRLFNKLKLSSTTPLENIGIDFSKDAYQYLLTTDSTSAFVTILPLKNVDKFEQYVKTLYGKKTSLKNKIDYKQLLQVNDTDVINLGWNKDFATFTFVNYTNRDYYYPHYSETVADSAAAVSTYSEISTTKPYHDSTVSLEPAAESVNFPPPDTNKIDNAKAVVEAAAAAATPDTIAPYVESKQEIIEREAREKFYKDQELKNDSIKKELAQKTIANSYTQFASIQNNNLYNKLLDNNADIFIWVDSTRFLNQLMGYSYNRMGFGGLPGYTQGYNLYFEKDRIKLEQKIISSDANYTKLYQDSYNSKQSTNLMNYISSNDLAFMSTSVNMEGLLNDYYPVYKKILSSAPYFDKYPDLVDAYVDLAEIIIDEKAVAAMAPGNMVMILHDIKPKKVKYITYNYDKDYNGKEVEKTKIEMSPDFSFIFETKNEKIFNKFINLPIKLNKDSSYDYKKTGDFYTLTLGDKNILNKLYFMVKDGKCIITTSLEKVANNNFKTNLSADVQQSILNNNYLIKIDTKTLIQKLSADQSCSKRQLAQINYLKNNVGDFKLESLLRNDIPTTTALFDIKGKHKNSFEYIFNVIDNLLKIDATVK